MIYKALENKLLVLEIGGNPKGDKTLFIEIIKAAGNLGAKAVKFQAYKVKDFIFPSNPSYFELLEEETPFLLLEEMLEFAHDLGLLCGITVFSEEGIELALKKKADFIKISSGDLTYHKLILDSVNSGIPLVLSTGASSEEEVNNSLKLIENTGKKLLCLLQCTSLYPTPPEQAHLSVLDRWLKEGKSAGLSDHTLGIDASLLAFFINAAMVEKHFTTNRLLPGGDNFMSITPYEAELILTHKDLEPKNNDPIMQIFKKLYWGESTKKKLPEERPELLRRGAVSTKNISKGKELSPKDIAYMRIGKTTNTPLGPEVSLCGKILTKDIYKGEPVFLSDLFVSKE
jgi:sialic acid synthase SpsE